MPALKNQKHEAFAQAVALGMPASHCTQSAVAAAPTGSGCPHCAARVQPWLIAYTEGWYGPREGWTERTRSHYYEWFAIVDSFARGFRFAPGTTQNVPALAQPDDHNKPSNT